jgi:hypothetical protein
VKAFPFSKQEWQKVGDVSLALVNATLSGDNVFRASLYVELVAVLDELRMLHGEHPVLLETEADFCDDETTQLEKYRSAVQLAEVNYLPTLSIRLSLARLLLTDFKDPSQAKFELKSCELEANVTADKSELREWSELMEECNAIDVKL